MNANVGSLLFIADPLSGKKRPHICIGVFTNNAGVKYDWLVLPITSVDTVGSNNLIPVKHRKLKKNSYAKINNIKTITADADIEIADELFDKEYIELIKIRLRILFK